jgi:hypothetical protein
VSEVIPTQPRTRQIFHFQTFDRGHLPIYTVTSQWRACTSNVLAPRWAELNSSDVFRASNHERRHWIFFIMIIKHHFSYNASCDVWSLVVRMFTVPFLPATDVVNHSATAAEIVAAVSDWRTQVSRDPYSWKNDLGSYDVICGLCCRLRLTSSAALSKHRHGLPICVVTTMKRKYTEQIKLSLSLGDCVSRRQRCKCASCYANATRKICVRCASCSPRTSCKCCAHLPREERATRDDTFGPLCM